MSLIFSIRSVSANIIFLEFWSTTRILCAVLERTNLCVEKRNSTNEINVCSLSCRYEHTIKFVQIQKIQVRWQRSTLFREQNRRIDRSNTIQKCIVSNSTAKKHLRSSCRNSFLSTVHRTPKFYVCDFDECNFRVTVPGEETMEIDKDQAELIMTRLQPSHFSFFTDNPCQVHQRGCSGIDRQLRYGGYSREQTTPGGPNDFFPVF